MKMMAYFVVGVIACLGILLGAEWADGGSQQTCRMMTRDKAIALTRAALLRDGAAVAPGERQPDIAADLAKATVIQAVLWGDAAPIRATVAFHVPNWPGYVAIDIAPSCATSLSRTQTNPASARR
jgi:hypothetical protein